MAQKQKQHTESQAIAVIDEALELLPDDDSRGRVLAWAMAKFGGAMRSDNARHPLVAPQQIAAQHQPFANGNDSYGARARAWMKKHSLTSDALESAFHIEGDTSTLILKTVRGASKRERLRNVAALLGAMALVKTDQPKFTGAEFREALKQYDAYDAANGPSYVKSHKDVIQGSASAGYTVTAIGLDLAASLLTPAAAD